LKIIWLKSGVRFALTWCAILGLAIGIYIWLTESSAIRWIAIVVGFSFVSLGLAIDGFTKVKKLEKTTDQIDITLNKMQTLVDRIQQEQKEGSSSGSSIFPTLQAFSQLYLDYLAKQEREKGQANDKDGKE